MLGCQYIYSKFYSTGISPKTKDPTLSPELQRCTAANTATGCRMAAASSEWRAKNVQSWGPDWMEQSLFSVLLWKWFTELSISTIIWKHPFTENYIEKTTLFLLSGMKYKTKFLLVRNMFGENETKHSHTHHWLQISLQWVQSKDFSKDFFFFNWYFWNLMLKPGLLNLVTSSQKNIFFLETKKKK